MKNVACSWSGGKDCCMALIEAKALGYNPVVLINMMNVDGKTSRSHGLPVKLLKQQANEMNMTLVTIPTTSENYEEKFVEALIQLKTDHAIEGVVYGDIDLVAHRDWQERVCRSVGLEAILPIWERVRTKLARQIVDAGIESIIVACNAVMGEEYLGKTYSAELINKLINLGVDSCGEDGEFHSFVINCPLYQNRISVPNYLKNTNSDFCFIDWENESSSKFKDATL